MDNRIVLKDNNQQEFLECFFDYLIENYGRDLNTIHDLEFAKKAFLSGKIAQIDEFIAKRIRLLGRDIVAELQLALFDVRIDGVSLIEKKPEMFASASWYYSDEEYYYSKEEIKERIQEVYPEDTNGFSEALLQVYKKIVISQLSYNTNEKKYTYENLVEDYGLLMRAAAQDYINRDDSIYAAEEIADLYLDKNGLKDQEAAKFVIAFGKDLMAKFNAEGWSMPVQFFLQRFMEKSNEDLTSTDLLQIYNQPCVKKFLTESTSKLRECVSELQRREFSKYDLFQFLMTLSKDVDNSPSSKRFIETIATLICSTGTQEYILDFDLSMPFLEKCIGSISSIFSYYNVGSEYDPFHELEFFAEAGDDKKLLHEKIKERVLEYKEVGVIFPRTYEAIIQEIQKYNHKFTKEDLIEGMKKDPKIKKLVYELNERVYMDGDIEIEVTEMGKIYPKTRLAFMPSLAVIMYLSEEDVKNFDLKTWNLFYSLKEFSNTSGTERACVEVMDVFGLFNKDGEVQKRRSELYKLFNLRQDPSLSEIRGERVSEKIYALLKKQGLDGEVNKYALEKAKKEGGEPNYAQAVLDLYLDQYDFNFYINSDLQQFNPIPEEFEYILGRGHILNEEYFNVVKNLDGNFGKRINDYLSPYAKQGDTYVLKRGVVIPELLRDVLKEEMTAEEYEKIKNTESYDIELLRRAKAFIAPFEEKAIKRVRMKNNIPKEIREVIANVEDGIFDRNILDANKIHRIFDGFDRVYKPEFCKFFIKYFDLLVYDDDLSKLKHIHKHWEEMIEFYELHGNSNPNYFDIMSYLEKAPFAARPGNELFAATAKKAGVDTQLEFSNYEQLLPKLKNRKVTTLPRHEKIYIYKAPDGKEYKIMTKMLRTDDPMTMLVGESKLTNCCQVYGRQGEACMEHASTSKDGGILAVYLVGDDGVPKMLTQSWTWTRETKLCLDNVEATNLITSKSGVQKRLYQDMATYGLKCAAEDLLKTSELEVEKYIQQKLAELDRGNLSPKEKKKEIEKLEELRERQTLKVITVGEGCDDLNVRESFPEIDTDWAGPKGYSGYRDSKEGQQHIIVAKGARIEADENYADVPIYRDKRRVSHQRGEKITKDTLQRIYEIERAAHKEEMRMYSDEEGTNWITEAEDLARLQGCSIDQLNIIIGEDWYYIYSDNGKDIKVGDFAKTEPRLADEAQIQQQEMNEAFNEILAQSVVIKDGKLEYLKSISADLREDTSYLLYLFQKKRGRVEQVGSDKAFFFSNRNYKEDVTEEKQEEILRNNRKVREEGNEECRMHEVTFIPTEKTIEHILESHLASFDERSL